MHEIRFSEKAAKQLDKLGQTMNDRIISVLDRIRPRPYDYIQILVGVPYYKLRVGDYRLILEVTQQDIIVVAIAHRKNAYDSLFRD
jgi:mRNA interferase RelE/StbE